MSSLIDRATFASYHGRRLYWGPMLGHVGFLKRMGVVLGALAVALAPGCGARSGVDIEHHDSPPGPVPHPEVCNGLDDDLDGLASVGALGDSGIRDGGMDASRPDAGSRDGGPDGGPRDGSVDADAGAGDLDLFVDEDFRDSMGRYITDAHCGGCGRACTPSRPHELRVACGLVEETPTCVALACDAGFVPSSTGRCVPAYDRLCLSCADDGDCGDFDAARCVPLGGELRCSVSCDIGCPSGYVCESDACVPPSRSCTCEVGVDFTLACALHDPDGNVCPGSAVCMSGMLSECVAPVEVCDEVDQNCDGVIDEGFRDARGAYILDIHNCGECGVDCTMSTIPEGDLICGGDPFAPTCVLHCVDADDGIQPGDRIDGDRNIATGCECTVTALDDVPGPVRASGPMLDVNCDGADGNVIQSFYVAPDGDDAAVGSPTRPLRTITTALRRASESLAMGAPRPHVFIASGTYTESIELPDGVLVHGGYRRDFLSLDPDGFRVEIRAPSDTTAPGGAAMTVRGAGTRETSIEWVALRGLDASEMSAATFGAVLVDPGPALALRDLEVRAGVAGSGSSRAEGTAGRAFTSMPTDGQPPRGAIEDSAHRCASMTANLVRGGAGGANVCGTLDTSGGTGGTATCPTMSVFQASGTPGNASGGLGGAGGQDSEGPITRETGTCPVAVCCGLADFSVPTDFTGPQPGRPGRDGGNGMPGRACAEPFGAFDGDRWIGVAATRGSAGSAGSGGGGGGAGGGAVMNWFDRVCEFVDGLGGGGGGGGAGGCGGDGGDGGTSGAPSVAILVRYTRAPSRAPAISGLRIAPSEGGRGGDGGAGGDGGRGANGAFGGFVPRADRSTPTLAGPFPGGRGGAGGNGGAGAGGGGGCGGASVGIWITGVTTEPAGVAAWRSGNTFMLGRAGTAGRGGGGAARGPDGAAGGSADVVVR